MEVKYKITSFPCLVLHETSVIERHMQAYIGIAGLSNSEATQLAQFTQNYIELKSLLFTLKHLRLYKIYRRIKTKYRE